MSDSIDDPFIQDLLDEYGPLGYMFWFVLIEIIAKENGSNLTGIVSIKPSYITRKMRCKESTARRLLLTCASAGKLSVSFQNPEWVINFPKMLGIKDNYTKDLQVSCKKPSNQLEADVEADVEKESGTTVPVPTQPKPESKRKPRKEAYTTEHAELVKYYCDQYEKINGVKYMFLDGKDAKIVQRLLKAYGLERVKQIMDDYLADSTPFVVNCGYSLGVLMSRVNQYAAKVSQPVHETRFLNEQRS